MHKPLVNGRTSSKSRCNTISYKLASIEGGDEAAVGRDDYCGILIWSPSEMGLFEGQVALEPSWINMPFPEAEFT